MLDWTNNVDFAGIEPDREPVHRHLQRVFGDGRSVLVMRGQRVPIGDEKEAFIFFLELEPILEGAEIMAEMETAGWPHAA